MKTEQHCQTRYGSFLGFMVTIAIGFVFYFGLPMLPHANVQWLAYGSVVDGIRNNAFQQIVWFFMNFTEADFFAGFFSSLMLIIGGFVAWRLAVTKSKYAGFPICYGSSAMWPWVLASQMLSLLLTMYAFDYMNLFNTPNTLWIPTFIVVVSTPPAVMLMYGGNLPNLLTASILPAVVATPLASWMSVTLMPLIQIPIGVAFVTTMGITGAVLGCVIRFLPWMHKVDTPSYATEPANVYTPAWSVRRALADFTEPHFWGNEVVTIFLLVGMLLDMICNNGHCLGGGAVKYLPSVLLSQFTATAVGIYLYASKFENNGWYATYVPVVSVGPFCVLVLGPGLPVALCAGVLGGIMGAPFAAALAERLPAGVHGFVANVFSMAIITTLVWAALKCIPWIV